MAAPALDWSSARVSERTLELDLSGDRPPGWKKSFGRVVRLLGGGEWGEVTLRKGIVSVAGVVPGSEDQLRHFLESIVEQVNATHPGARDADPEDAVAAPSGPDAGMTDRFRSFAGR